MHTSSQSVPSVPIFRYPYLSGFSKFITTFNGITKSYEINTIRVIGIINNWRIVIISYITPQIA